MDRGSTKLNILLTSVGRRSYLVEYFKNALNGQGKVFVGNSSEFSPAFQVADDFVVTPLIYDDSYIPFLKMYCTKNKIDAIISLFDVDLLILSKHKKEFKDIGVTVLVSDYEIVRICNDKWATYKFINSIGLDTPVTYLSVETALEEIHNGKLNYPVIIKPRWGMGSIGVFEAENDKELQVLYEKVRKIISQTYLKYESVKNIEEGVLIQEKLMGHEYGLDIINDLQGKYINTVSKLKYAMRSGETDCAKIVLNQDLKSLGEKLSRKTQHIANLDADVFYSRGQYYILEMNARFGGGYPFSHMAGVNLPMAIVKWLKGEEVDNTLLKEKDNILVQKDIRMVIL